MPAIRVLVVVLVTVATAGAVARGATTEYEYRVWGAMAAFATERDKALNRPTLAWLYTVRDPRRSGKGEIEIGIRKDRGRWILLGDIVESWSS